MSIVPIDTDPSPHPNGELSLQVVALPGDVNQHGLIHGGWLEAHMDMACNLASTSPITG